MRKIMNEMEYEVVMQRIDELVEIVDDNTDKTDTHYIELDALTDLVVAYEEEHFFVKQPVLVNTVKFHDYEMKNAHQNRLQTKRAITAPAKFVKRVASLA